MLSEGGRVFEGDHLLYGFTHSNQSVYAFKIFDFMPSFFLVFCLEVLTSSLKKKHDFNKQRGKEQYAFKIFDLVSYAQLKGAYCWRSLIKQGLLKSKILKA